MSNVFIDYLRSHDTYTQLCDLHLSLEGNLLQINDYDTSSAQIEAIRFILRKVKPKKILETGTNKGLFAYLLSHLVYDPVTLYTFGLEEQSAACVELLNQTQDMVNIHFYFGDSKTTLSAFEEQGIDFAWIDGGHDMITSYNDIKNCIRLNIPSILIDDTKYFPHIQYIIDNVLSEHPEYVLGLNPFYDRDSRGAALIQRN